MIALYDYASLHGISEFSQSALARLFDEGTEGLIEKLQEGVLYQQVIEEGVRDEGLMAKIWPYLAVFTKDLNKPVTRR